MELNMYLSAHGQHRWKTSLDYSHPHLLSVEPGGDLPLTVLHSGNNFSTPLFKVTAILLTNSTVIIPD